MGTVFTTFEIGIMALATVVTVATAVWPKEWRERAEYERRMVKKGVLGGLVSWGWESSYTLVFIVLSLQAAATGLYLLDAYNLASPSATFNAVVGLQWSALLVWRVAAFQVTDYFHKDNRRIVAASMMTATFALQGVSLGLLISEVASSPLSTATSVVGLIGWAALALYLFLSVINHWANTDNKVSKYIVKLYDARRARLKVVNDQN